MFRASKANTFAEPVGTCMYFSDRNIKPFDMVLLFSSGTLDLSVLSCFFLTLFLFPHELIQERARVVLQQKEAQPGAGVTLEALPLSLPSPAPDKQQVKWIYRLAEIISFSLVLSAQMESRPVSNLSPESAGVGLIVYKDSKSSRLINLLSCSLCCMC